MAFIAGAQLIRRSDSELGALFMAFNAALARAEPYSEEWKDAQLSVENILRERKSRVNRPAVPGF